MISGWRDVSLSFASADWTAGTSRNAAIRFSGFMKSNIAAFEQSAAFFQEASGG
jgi:hypothetical protein